MTASRPRRRRSQVQPPVKRQVDYHNLRSPFPPVPVFDEDRVVAIHDAALELLAAHGLKILEPEARALYAAAGAQVDEDSQMVWLGRDLVESAIAQAPKRVVLKAGRSGRDLVLELGRMVFQPGAGCPHATDLVRGRRPGTLNDFRDLLRLTHHFDVLHMLPPLVEPQDVPLHLRHYAMTEAQLTLSDKFPFVFSRGTAQVADCFEMLRIARGLDRAAFQTECWCYTIINTNSPRQIDIPMARGLIDFARAGQLSIVTPFTLMGAMAPITVAGALTLSHAEAMAAIALTQLARPGAPVCYGTFTSNVDMKSGAPAFGTPEHVKASLGAGQLARHLGLPWRCAAGSAANVNDAQAAHETEISAWGSVLAGATVVIHGAGWLEGGLTISYEKLITDVEMLQVFAELCTDIPATQDDIALDALAQIAPGGHFFGAALTMARYQTEFYEPVIADWSNFGTWTENGSQDANARATKMWQDLLAQPELQLLAEARAQALTAFVAKRTAAGGAAPESEPPWTQTPLAASLVCKYSRGLGQRPSLPHRQETTHGAIRRRNHHRHRGYWHSRRL